MATTIYLAIDMEKRLMSRKVVFATPDEEAAIEWAGNRDGRAYTDVELADASEVEDRWLYMDDVNDY